MGHLVTGGLGGRGAAAGGPPPTSGADDLLGAVQTRLNTVPQLVTDLGGRIYLGEAGSATATPYLLVTDDSHLQMKTSTTEVHLTTLRFRVYAPDIDVAGPIGDRVEDALKGRALTWSRGWSSPLVPGDRRQRPDRTTQYQVDRARGGKSFYLEVSFTCRTVRDLS